MGKSTVEIKEVTFTCDRCSNSTQYIVKQFEPEPSLPHGWYIIQTQESAMPGYRGITMYYYCRSCKEAFIEFKNAIRDEVISTDTGS